MNNQDNFEKIDAYLNGDLTGKALEQFEQHLRSDQDFAAQVNLFKNIDAALVDEEALALQQQTESLGMEYFNQIEKKEAKIKKLPFYRRPLSIAASVIFLVACGMIWWLVNSSGDSVSNEALFASHYEPYSLSNLVRGGVDQNTIYDQAMDAYSSSDLTNATRLFQTHIANKPNDMMAIFSLATVYLQQSPPALDDAARYYQAIINDGNSILVSQAQWYLALIRIKQDDRESAKGLLEELMTSEDSKLMEQAEDLLDKL